MSAEEGQDREETEQGSGTKISEENYASDEWIVIDDGKRKNMEKNPAAVPPEKESAGESSYSDLECTSGAEEVREANQRTEMDVGTEESDGVSVITESENEERVQSRIVLYENRSVRTASENPTNVSLNVDHRMKIWLIFGLLLAIGLGLCFKVTKDNAATKNVDYATIKMEHDRLMEKMQELSGMKEILHEIKANIIREKGFVDMGAEKFKEKHQDLDSTTEKPNYDLHERLQMLLRTVCLVLEDVRESGSAITRKSMCDMHSFFSDFTNQRLLLKDVIAELDEAAQPAHQRFLENVESQITFMSDTLVTDFARAFDKLNTKNQRKLEKIVHRMNEKLCILRNTMSSDSKTRQLFDNDPNLIEKCKKTLASKKFNGKNFKPSYTPTDEKVAKKGENSKKYTDSYPSKPVDYLTKKENRTKSYYNGNAWTAKKCYRDKASSGESSEIVDVCQEQNDQQFSKHPKKYEKRSDDSGETKKFSEKKKRPEEKSFNPLEKNDPPAPEYLKKKTEFDTPKKRKKSFSSNEEIRADGKSTKKDKKSPPITPNENSHVKHERTMKHENSSPITSNENSHVKKVDAGRLKNREKKKFEKEKMSKVHIGEAEGPNNREKPGQESMPRRSRSRGQSRQDETIDDWYINRLGNRRESRINYYNRNSPIVGGDHLEP